MLVNVLLIVLIIAGLAAIFFVIQLTAATPATITPNLSQIGAGQYAAITVTWTASSGGAPYTVYLYESPTSGSCGTSSTFYAAKTPLTTPGWIFNVNPTTTTYYCGTVAGAKGSSAVSAIVTVKVNPALVPPTLVLSPPGIDTGQTVTIKATVSWVGGSSPYTVTLYSGSNSTCAQNTAKAVVLSGSNPLSSLTGTSTTFSVKDPISTVYYCAVVTDSASVPHTLTSSPESFDVNRALSVGISPSRPTVDSGQTATLTAVPSQGTQPYSYQWYTGTTCSAGSEVTGATSSVLTTGPLTSTPKYSVSVTDASSASPSVSVCGSVSIIVNPAFTGTNVVVSPSGAVLDMGQSVNLVASWTLAGTPPYIAQFYTSSTSTCQSKTALGLPQDVSTASANLTFSPTSTAYYCVSVKDGAAVSEEAASAAGVLVTVNPAITPSISLSLSAIDSGQTATVTATVTWTGGTSPYSVTLYSGTATDCASDTTKVAVLSPGANPKTGVSGTSATFMFTAPAATTQYCASIADGATTPKAARSAVVQFTVNQALTASAVGEPGSVSAPVIDNGSSITLNAVASHGTSPYSYQWYTGSACAAGNAISGATALSYSTGAIKSTRSYSVRITDASAVQSCAPAVTVIVNPALDPNLVLSISAIDSGQTATVTATVTWTGGTPSYAVTLYSGTGASCASYTSKVAVLSGSSNPQTGITGTSAAIAFTAPASSTHYCASVKDSATVQVTNYSSVLLFNVNPVVTTPSIVLSPSVMDFGQTATLVANVTWTGGTSPYTVTLYSSTSSSCSSSSTMVAVLPDPNPQTGLTVAKTAFFVAAPASTTYYCAVVTDGSGAPAPATSLSAQLTVNPALTATISPSTTTISSQQPTAITLTAVATGGTTPYQYQWYSGSACSSGAISGQTSSSYSPGVITSTTTYSVRVKDSGQGSPAASSCATVTVALISPAAPYIDSGQSILLTAVPSPGVQPYSYQWYTGSSCANAITGATSSTYSTGALTSTTLYSAKVTWVSPGTPAVGVCGSATVTVLTALTATLSPVNPSIDSGQSLTLTAVPYNGASPYSYKWYTGLSCVTQMLGYTQPTYSTPTLTSTTTYSVSVGDSGSGTPAVSVCVGATVTVNPTFTGTTVTLLSSASTLDSGQSVTMSVSWAGGTSPYSVKLTTSSSATCPSSSSTGYLQTGIVGTSTTFTITPTSTAYYCATVTDSALSAESAYSVSVEVSVNQALTAPVISASPAAIGLGENSSITTTTSFSGGTAAYTCQWLVEAPASGSFSNLGGSFSCSPGDKPSTSTGDLLTLGTWNFELQVTDGLSSKAVSLPFAVTVS